MISASPLTRSRAPAREEIACWERTERAEQEKALDHNDRILRLAEHNGYAIELRPFHDGRRLFMVPIGLRKIAGADALVVR